MLSLRLSKEEQEASMAEYETTYSVQYEAVMNGYVIVPEEVFKYTELLYITFAKSFAFVKTRRPGSAKKKK